MAMTEGIFSISYGRVLATQVRLINERYLQAYEDAARSSQSQPDRTKQIKILWAEEIKTVCYGLIEHMNRIVNEYQEMAMAAAMRNPNPPPVVFYDHKSVVLRYLSDLFDIAASANATPEWLRWHRTPETDKLLSDVDAFLKEMTKEPKP